MISRISVIVAYISFGIFFLAILMIFAIALARLFSQKIDKLNLGLIAWRLSRIAIVLFFVSLFLAMIGYFLKM